MKEFVIFILVAIMVLTSLYVCITVWDFIVEIPRQLKRIADELERRNRDGN